MLVVKTHILNRQKSFTLRERHKGGIASIKINRSKKVTFASWVKTHGCVNPFNFKITKRGSSKEKIVMSHEDQI